MFRRRLCRVDRTASIPERSQPWAAFALVLIAGGCNLLLDNEQRALRSPLVPPPRDSGAATDSSEPPDASVDASPEASTSEPDAAPPDAGNIPASCLGSGQRPECTPDKREEDKKGCGLCELGRQTRARTCAADCTWGAWSEWTDCLEFDDVCAPGTVDDEPTGPCGDCNTGSGKRTRICTDSCGWSDWSAITCTPDPDHCRPGAMEPLDRVACPGMCSSRPVTRTCNDACNWDAPVMGECTAAGACMPGTTRMTTGACNPSFCDKGEQQQLETCSASCTWGSPVGMGPCTIPTNVCRPLDLGGMRGWRCRPGDPGFREYCHASTSSEAQRCTWDGTREPYTGPC